MKKLMFVIPFAGGSSFSFTDWDHIQSFKVFFVDLPGKGKNKDMPHLESMGEMVTFCVDYILSILKNKSEKEYYLWGHSMGSYLAYEVVKVLKDKKEWLPKGVVLSGTAGPKRIKYEEIQHALSCDKFFLEYIVDYGMISEKVSQSSFFQKQFLPVIRNDYKVLSDYCAECSVISGLKVLIINGESDTITIEDAMQWSEYFEEVPCYKWLPGGHFFILNSKEVIVNVLEAIDCT